MFRLKVVSLGIFLALFPSILFSQSLPESKQALLKSLPEYQLMEKALQSKRSLLIMGVSADPQEIDAQQYTLDIEFFPDTYSITGVVTIDAATEASSVDTIYIDCQNTLTINSLQFNDVSKSYTHSDDKITLSFSPPIDPYQSFEVEISYDGTFTPFQDRGLIFEEHGVDNIPTISNLSETYLAPSWWPCIDNPADKALVDFNITCPTQIDSHDMLAFSNGTLTGTTDNGGTTTFHWSETNPIATYLVMVAISDYYEITSLPSVYNTMPLYYHCYPEDLVHAEYHYAQVYDLIELYSNLLGEYPFLDEKHGIIEITMGSLGMEHQTITCIDVVLIGDPHPSNARVTIGHEIAHQWFGDFVTMKTWNDIWLNEGFATFFQFYYREAFGEIAATIDKLKIFGINLFRELYEDPIYVRDITDPFANSGTIYFKGAWVVHMLREMIDNDTLFFSILETYLSNHAYSNADTDDLRTAFETGLSTTLDHFFDQWIYTPAWPIYSILYEISSRDGGYKVDINLRQTQTHDVVDISEQVMRNYYIMPIEFTVHYTDETTEIFQVTNDQRNQSFQLLTTKEPDHIVFDESLNILKEAFEEIADNDGIPSDGDFSGIPGDNPCTGGATENCDDNCPEIPNGPDGGTCTSGSIGDSCTIPGDNESECGIDGFCSMAQEDSYPPQGNGIGDTCDCEADFDCDGNVDATDVSAFLADFGRSLFFLPCTNEEPCNGDFNCDVNVDATDVTKFLEDFGRSTFFNPCPACVVGNWCSYL